MAGNLPDDVSPGSPKAPWNREPPMQEEKAMAVTLDVVITVSEHAEKDHERDAIMNAIDRGDYELIEHETMDVLDRRRP